MELELATTEQLISELFRRFDLACFAGRKRRQSVEIDCGDALLTMHSDAQAIKSDGTQDVATLIDNLHGCAFEGFLESGSCEDDE